MIRQVSFFHAETGIVHPSLIVGDEDVIRLNTPEGHIAIDGFVDGSRFRVDVHSGDLIDYTPPPDPVAEADKRRTLSLRGIGELERSQHRAIREHLLGDPSAAARLKSIDDQIAALRAGLST